MTVEQLCVLAMSRTSEVTTHYPTNRALMYRRVGLRQRELMAQASRVNPDYYGVCAESPLDTNLATDLNDIVEPVPTPELIERIEIADPGSGQWARGDEIAIVPASQTDAELPPRATLRDLVLQSVSNDLLGVLSVEVYYSRLPALLTSADGATEVELQSPWDELLVLDLNRWLIQKATRLEATIRTSVLAEVAEEEKPMLAGYTEHVRTYQPMTTRFARRVAR